MTIFGPLEILAKTFLVRSKGVICVHKASRVGATTSLVKVALELCKKVVLVYPTKRIAKEIEMRISKLLSKQQPRIAIIWPNSELCRKCDPKLPLKFQLKKDCSKCIHLERPEECHFQELILNDFNLYCLTYDKLLALLMSSSPESRKLLKKLQACDVFILDEFTTAVVRHISTIPLVTTDENGKTRRMSEHIKADFEVEFNRTDRIISEDLYEENSFLFKESRFWAIVIDLFLSQFERVQSGLYKNPVWKFLSKSERRPTFQHGWSMITKLASAGRNTAELQDVFLAAFAEEIVVTRENGTVKLTPRIEDALSYIREFCQKLEEEKPVFVIDSYQPSIGFDNVFGRPVKHVLWGEDGDPLNTNENQLIVCNTAHWGAQDFLRDKRLQRKVKLFVNQVVRKLPPKHVLVVTTNKKMAGIVGQWNLPKDVRVTWFRSDWMRGVSIKGRRVMICIGGPYIPKKAYDASAKSFRIESFAKDLELLEEDAQRLAMSRILRLDDTRSEFVNAIGRVKDPKARERSLVFTLGMQKHEVSLLLKQDAQVSEPNLIQPLRKGGMLRDGVWIAELWLNELRIFYSISNFRDLPMIARIISRTRNKVSIRASEVVPGMTDVVVETAKRYKHELGRYNVSVIEKRGGVTFYANYVTLDHFSEK